MKLQILDCDYTMLNNKPLIRLFCKDEKGETVCVFYDKILPYFYAHTSSENFRKIINELQKKWKIDATVVEKYLPIGYGPKKRLLKIIGRDPSQIPEMREIASKYSTPYEADILFRYRAMVDLGIKGMEWIEVHGSGVHTTTVKCKTVHAETIKPLSIEKNAPMRFLGIDIETVSETDEPQEAGKTPIIMIALTFEPAWRGKKKAILLAKPFSKKNVIDCQNETEMLKKFIEILHDYDPDIITGYNINGFDMPFVIERMKALKIQPYLGRTEKQASVRKLMGTNIVTIVGRVVVDSYEIIRRDPRLRFKRYDLKTIAKEMIGEEKLEMGGPAEIKAHWNGGVEKINKLIEYCSKDSELALKLITEKRLLDKFFELAKISGLLLQDVFGGQSQRHECKLLHVFKERDFVMPCRPDAIEMRRRIGEREKYGLKGAIVLEPEVGLYLEECVLVLDFASLYPSIIQSFNICPTTYIREDVNVAHHKAPNGAKFVDKEVRIGVLPTILKELIESRLNVKKEMAKEKDQERWNLLNAKQLALKDMANSLYGYTGYIRSRLYVMDVANAITSYGRENILKTKNLIEREFRLKILYGDTDSIFIKTNIKDLESAENLGKKISEYVTSKLTGLRFSFEKIFKSFLILSKKRYAGLAYERRGEIWKEKIDMKGIETVRRDWCDLTLETMNEVLRIILKEQNVKKAISHTRDVIKALNKGEVPLEKLTVVKGITKNLDAYDGTQPHVELAKKIRARDPSRGSMVGERLGYVIIKGNTILSKRAEDPEYVKQHKLEIDSQYYIENQLLPPLERIFEIIGITKAELIEGTRQKNLFDIAKKVSMKATLERWDSIQCASCSWRTSMPALTGVCPHCGGELYFANKGKLGYYTYMK